MSRFSGPKSYKVLSSRNFLWSDENLTDLAVPTGWVSSFLFPKAGNEQVSQNRDSSNGKHDAQNDDGLSEYAWASIAEPNQNKPEKTDSQSDAEPAPFLSFVAPNLRHDVS
jgi:hypothetical protein